MLWEIMWEMLWEILQEMLWEILQEIFKICKSSVGNAVGNSAGNAVGNLVGNGFGNDAVFSLNMWLRTIYCSQTILEPACVILTLFQYFVVINENKGVSGGKSAAKNSWCSQLCGGTQG